MTDSNPSDHDILLVVSNDVKHMVEWTKNHTNDDDRRHVDNLKRFEKIEENDKWQNKIIYGCIGIVIFIEVISKIVR